MFGAARTAIESDLVSGKAGRAESHERLGSSVERHVNYVSRVPAHGTRLFYELLSCGEPFRRMGRGGWPAMRSLQQWMASLWVARRIFLSRSKPTRKID